MGVWLQRHSWIVPYALLLPGLLWLRPVLRGPAFQMFLVVVLVRDGGDGLRVLVRTTPTTRTRSAVRAVLRPFDRVRAARRRCSRSSSPIRSRTRSRSGAAAEEPAAVPRRRAVLHELPAPHDLLEDHPRRQRACSSGRSRTSAWCPRTSACWPRRWPSSPGITYNFLPFMTLPIYVALEKVDLRLVEAARGPVRRAVAAGRRDRRRGRWRRAGGGPGRGLRVRARCSSGAARRHRGRGDRLRSWCPRRSSG